MKNTSTKKLIIVLFPWLFFSCSQPKTSKPDLSKDEMLEIVKNCGRQFSIGLQKQDSLLLVTIYSDSAQYVIPNRQILQGKIEIGKEWADFLRIKEKPVDLLLFPKDVRGTREIIYETGQGYTLLADSTKWHFNYVNIWRLQQDNTYKLEVDAYN
jgi:ketosteroid isomerase-like protein